MDNVQLTIGKYLNGELKVLPPQVQDSVNQFVASNTVFAWIWGILSVLAVLLIVTMLVRHVVISSTYHRDWYDDELGIMTIFGSGIGLIFLLMAFFICLNSAMSPLQALVGG